MGAIWTIGRMTFLEARRNRILWSLLFFCIVLVLTSFMFQEVTVAAFDRVVRDVGLASIHAFGILLAVFLGVTVVTREIERRTVYPVLARPVSRASYLAGKLLGVWVTLIVCLGAMLLAFLVEAVAYKGPIKAILFETWALILIELLLLASFSILASTFTSSIMSAFMSVALFIIGHASQDIYFFARKSKAEIVQKVGAAIFYVLPNLERLNLKSQASTLTEVPISHVLLAAGYGLIYVVAFFVVAVALFQRRDLK